MSKPMEDNDVLVAELDALLGAGLLKEVALPPVEEEPATEPLGRGSAASDSVGERPPAPVQPSAEPVTAARKVKPLVLVMDDSQDYREVVSFLLSDKGYDVITAQDGEEGLRLAARETPDLVLLDFNMPGMNGYEVIQELRNREETRKIPIAMFTGAPNRWSLKEMGLDVVDFLEKPISNARLLEAVLRILPPGQPKAETAKAAAPAPSGQAVAVPDLEAIGREDLDDHSALLVDLERGEEAEPAAGLEALAEDSPLINRVNKIIVRAVEMGASDIHIEPQEKQIAVRVRLNGSLQQLCTLPSELAARLAARVKILCDLSITERRVPQDGQFRAAIEGRKTEFRVSTLPSAYGEKIVMRILGGTKIKPSLKDLGFLERDLVCVERAIESPHGLVLVTGPTGSGKTTSLYTMVAAVNRPDVNVLTAEDPIEYRLPGITQVHVKPDLGLTFESVLRAFLRQDPDVMLIGEIRDLETAEIAVKASITGHLVLSTLHTNSAAATITRLTHMGVAPFLVAGSLKLVVAQRLVKVLCPDCKTPVALSAEERRLLSDEEAAGLKQLYRGLGCAKCHQTGYVGRKPIFEVMPVQTPGMRQLIFAKASADQINEEAVREGMTSLRMAAMAAVSAGETSLSEALKIILAD